MLQLQDIIAVAALALSGVSALVTAYFWFVRSNQERPNLKTFPVSGVDQAVDFGGRAAWLAAFVDPQKFASLKSPAGTVRQYFLLRIAVVNNSILPNTVIGLKASVQGTDGNWVPLNTAFAVADEARQAPFRFNAQQPHMAQPDSRDPLPTVQAFNLPPRETTVVQVVMWTAVPLSGRWFEWMRFDDAQLLKFGSKAALDRVTSPLTFKIEIKALSNRKFTDTFSADEATADAHYLAEPSLPALPEPKPLEAGSIDRLGSDLRAAFDRLQQPDGSIALSIFNEEPYRDAAYYHADCDAPLFALSLARSMGWSLPDEGALRRRLLAAQRPDGSFAAGQTRWPADSFTTRFYGTAQTTLALALLGARPEADPLPVIEEALPRISKEDWQPLYAAIAVRVFKAMGRSLPTGLDAHLRERLATVKGDDGNRLWDLAQVVAFDRLTGRSTANADEALTRALTEYGTGWSFWIDTRNRVGTERTVFAGVFLVAQLGRGRPAAARLLREVTKALFENGAWREGGDGFGSPYDPCDAELLYCVAATLQMAGELPPPEPTPTTPELIGHGHLAKPV